MHHRFLHLIFGILTSSLFIACHSKEQADVIYFNGHVYTVDSSFSISQAMAIKDGKIIAIGMDKDLESYQAKEKINLNGKFVYPGFIDAHCHFYGYGVDLKKISLYGTNSWNSIIDSLSKYQDKRFMGWVFGRGWDQNDWKNKAYPDKAKLDSLFPDVPVFLMRIDGHAALVNQKALDLAGIKSSTKLNGGEIGTLNGKLTGLLIDNAVDLVKLKIPAPSRAAEIEALLQAQKNCFEVGLTSIDDAGLDVSTILLIDSLQKTGDLKMRYYAMIAYNKDNKEYFFKNGKIKTAQLNVCAFKIYADGALGSRGALLEKPYADETNHFGLWLTPWSDIKTATEEMVAHDFQLCVHCIGDSSNHSVLELYGKALKGKSNKRWRIEHAQVVDEADFHWFKDASIIPSVQPTHATSDMYWAEERLGKERVKNAYAYNKLLKNAGLIAAGSDFPVEDINPLFGFYAASVRKDKKNFPDSGFQMENSITREQALRAMTIWAAYSNFEETEKGSLEKGKWADFVITDEDLMQIPDKKLWLVKVRSTYVSGERVFQIK